MMLRTHTMFNSDERPLVYPEHSSSSKTRDNHSIPQSPQTQQTQPTQPTPQTQPTQQTQQTPQLMSASDSNKEHMDNLQEFIMVLPQLLCPIPCLLLFMASSHSLPTRLWLHSFMLQGLFAIIIAFIVLPGMKIVVVHSLITLFFVLCVLGSSHVVS
jgi:hypothetical protein